MTLSELLADCYRRLDFQSTPATATTTRLTAFINETQQELLSEPGMGALLNGSLTFASEANTPRYALPLAAARVHAIYEATNDNKLDARTLDWYRTVYPDSAAVTGIPDTYVDMGFSAVNKQPSNLSNIYADSTNALDVGTVYIEGYSTGGYVFTASATMTGTTAVLVGAYNLITRAYLSAAAIGEVTLHEDAEGGTELARIGIGQTTSRYRHIALVPTPASAITYTVDFDWDAQNLVNANDEPLIPVRFHRLLAVGARMREYEKTDDQNRYAAAKRELEEGKRKLKHFVYASAAATPNLRGYAARRASQLGAWFPAGS